MEIRLATFNLENLGIRQGDDAPEARVRLPRHMEALRRVIYRMNADAVAFQELVDPDLLDPLLAGLGYEHIVVAERGASPLRCGVFSRFPLRDPSAVATGVDVDVLDRRTGFEVRVQGAFSRPALRVIWDVPGFAVTLIVVHWKSKIPSYTPARRDGDGDRWDTLGDAGEGRLVTEVKRLAQAVQIRRVVDHLLREDPDARIAVLGDFNDTLESEGLRIVVGDARSCESPGLAPMELLPCELAVSPGLRYTQIYRGRREMLDHILISRGLVPHFVGARVFNEGLRPVSDSLEPDPYDPGSDHAPLLAVFRVG